MSPRACSPAALIALALLTAGAYGIRYGLMENLYWLDACVDDAGLLACQARSALGWLIHFRVIAWASLIFAVVAFVLPAGGAKISAWLGLAAGVPALVLYTASLATFAVVLAGLRVVRR